MLEHLERNKSLLRYNTFKLDVKARYFINSASADEIIRYGQFAWDHDIPLLILGGGSNVLLTKDFEGLVIVNKTEGIHIIAADEDEAIIESASGVVWHELVMFAVNHHLGGIENLSLIPGSVGAAPMQNIGAYGVELKEVLKNVSFYNFSTKERETYDTAACQFAYRESVFKHQLKNKVFIEKIRIVLKKHSKPNTSYGAINDILSARSISSPGIKDVSDAVISIRQSKLPDPEVLGNAGSFFKNPEIEKTLFEQLKKKFEEIPFFVINEHLVKIPAAWLIEQCGWKGKIHGHTGNHQHQALVIVNYGAASGEEIYRHSEQVISSVFEKFGILLSREVNIF